MQELSFDLGHIRLTGLGFGDPANPMIFATHGWLDNAASFIPLSQYLEDYYIVALDFAGHGKSDHRAQGAHYHILDNIFDMHTLIESQGWKDILFLGHSMGGILAGAYTACFPELAKGLVLMEAFGALTKEPESSPQQLRDSIRSRLDVNIKPTSKPSSIEQAVQARLMAGRMLRESAELLMRRNIKHTDDGFEWRTDRRLRTLSSLRLTEPQADAFLHGIECPTLSILGKQGFDELKPIQANKKYLIRNFRSTECVGGHHLHMDNPQEVAQKIKEFFQEI